mmetsp:Transcript_1232/g.3435  ORF Transcript_1232/g.3435 Transcript_1232/m.3435 type:complete len:247 (-) Transcript_1232:23-763(-)
MLDGLAHRHRRGRLLPATVRAAGARGRAPDVHAAARRGLRGRRGPRRGVDAHDAEQAVRRAGPPARKPRAAPAREERRLPLGSARARHGRGADDVVRRGRGHVHDAPQPFERAAAALRPAHLARAPDAARGRGTVARVVPAGDGGRADAAGAPEAADRQRGRSLRHEAGSGEKPAHHGGHDLHAGVDVPRGGRRHRRFFWNEPPPGQVLVFDCGALDGGRHGLFDVYRHVRPGEDRHARGDVSALV